MPNIIYNRLEITGNQLEITKFIQDHKKNINNHIVWDFGVSVKLSDSDDINAQKIKKWGTYYPAKFKFNINNIIYLDTQWTSFDKWVENIIEKYPNFIFNYTYYDDITVDYYGWIVGAYGKFIGGEHILDYYCDLQHYGTHNIINLQGNIRVLRSFCQLHMNSEEDVEIWDFSRSVKLPNYKLKTKLENWGTNDNAIIHSIDNNNIHLKTALTPCIEWIKKIIQKFPDITVTYKYYDELSQEYYGWLIGLNGIIIASDHINLSINKDGLRSLYKYSGVKDHINYIYT